MITKTAETYVRYSGQAVEAVPAGLAGRAGKAVPAGLAGRAGKAHMQKHAFAVKPLMGKATRYGLDPLSVGLTAYGLHSGTENVPGAVGGVAGGAAAGSLATKARQAINKSNWAKNLLSRVGGKYGKALSIGGSILGGLSSLGASMVGFTAGGAAGRSLGKTPKAFAVPKQGPRPGSGPGPSIAQPGTSRRPGQAQYGNQPRWNAAISRSGHT